MISQIYALYFNELKNYMIIKTKNIAEAEDIVQEAFIRALENADVLDELNEKKCRAWLYKTANNIFIDKIRRMKAEPKCEGSLASYDDLSNVMVAQICNLLDERDRNIFYLRYFSGYNAREISEIFDMTPSAVRVRLLYIRNKLREELNYGN